MEGSINLNGNKAGKNSSVLLPEFTTEEFKQFRTAYNKAVNRSADSFEFKGQVFHTGLAKCTIEFLTDRC